MLMRATLDTLGERTAPSVVGGLLPGLPASVDGADERRRRASARFDFLAVPRRGGTRELRAARAASAESSSLPGFFEETLPGLGGRRWAVARLDADTYEATRLALECLYPGLAVGGYLIVDDYGSFEGCRRAVDEFRSRARHHGADRADRLHRRALARGRATRRLPSSRPGVFTAAPRGRGRGPGACPDGARGRARRAGGASCERAVARRAGADRAAAVAWRPGEARPMIVFAQLDHRSPSSTSGPRRRASSSPRSRTPRCSPTPPRGRIFRSYNLIMDRSPSCDDLEALVLLHQDAEIADPELLHQAAGGAGRPGGRRRRLRRRHRRAQHRLVGGLGDLGLVRPPLRRARRRRAAGVLVERRRRCPPTPAPARSTPSTASCSASRRGSCATSASTSRSASCTATTSTSACRCAPPAARSSRPTSRSIHHHSLDLIERPGDLDRGAHAGRREVGRAHAGRRRGAAATGSSAPGAPRPRRPRRGRSRVSTQLQARRPRTAARARARRRSTESISWRLTEPLRRLNALRKRRRRQR